LTERQEVKRHAEQFLRRADHRQWMPGQYTNMNLLQKNVAERYDMGIKRARAMLAQASFVS
jgi:ribosomal protein S2